MMKLHISWWCLHILHEHEMSWLANQSNLYKKKCDMQIHCASENKLSYWKKKKITHKIFGPLIKDIVNIYTFWDIFFLLIWHNFPHQITAPGNRLYIVHQKPKNSRFYFFLSLFLYIFFSHLEQVTKYNSKH